LKMAEIDRSFTTSIQIICKHCRTNVKSILLVVFWTYRTEQSASYCNRIWIFESLSTFVA